MSGNSKHSKHILKISEIIYVILFYVVDGRTILFSFICKFINHHAYIYLSCYLIKTPMMLRFPVIIIY